MKLHHIVTALALAVALPLAVAVSPAAAEDPPTATLTVTGPSNGATVASGKPTFTWTPVAGSSSYYISVTSSSKTDAAGVLDAGGSRYVDGEEAASSAAHYVSKFTYAPGTYYWQVTTNVYTQATEENAAYQSVAQKFVVPARFVLSKFTAKVSTNPANGLREVEVNGKLACNLTNTNSPMTIAIKVFKGKKKVGSQTRDGGYCMGGTKTTKEFLNFQPHPGAIKKGSKLTIEVTASYKKAKSAVKTLKLTWK